MHHQHLSAFKFKKESYNQEDWLTAGTKCITKSVKLVAMLPVSKRVVCFYYFLKRVTHLTVGSFPL
jgi:hypothetical protein